MSDTIYLRGPACLPRAPGTQDAYDAETFDPPAYATAQRLQRDAIFAMCLPFLFAWAIIWGRSVTGVNADAVWFVKMAGTVLLPFGAVFWYLAITHLVLQKKSSYLVQFLVFVTTAMLVYLMLTTGVYSLSCVGLDVVNLG